MQNAGLTIAIFIILLLIGAAGWWLYTEGVFDRRDDTSSVVPPPPPPPPAPTVSRVRLAFLDTAGTSTGETRGCDKVVFQDISVPSTTAPLTAAMNALFELESERVGGFYNFIARTNNTLGFERAEVRDGVAHIYLTGSLSGLAGVCDDPRATIQIEETALQFTTVQSVQLYLNGSTTPLTPNERGDY